MSNITDAKKIIDKIDKKEKISYKDALTLLSSFEYDNNLNKKKLDKKEKEEIKELKEYLREKAREKADKIFGKYIFMRGLVEFTNYCKNDCIYCGIRKSNKNAERYRLNKKEILECCKVGYDIGFRTCIQGKRSHRYSVSRQNRLSAIPTGSGGLTWRKENRSEMMHPAFLLPPYRPLPATRSSISRSCSQ